MPVELYGPVAGGGGAGGSISIGASTGGNTAGTTGTVSNGMIFFGGANITLSESTAAGGGTLSIIGGAGGAFSAGVSSGGNSAGTTGTVANGIRFFGGNNITLSQSSAAGGATISIVAPTTIPIGTAVKGVSSIGSTGTITRFAPEDHQHAGVFSIGMSTGGNTLGTTAVFPGQMVFAGGTNITLSQATAAGNLMTLSILGQSGTQPPIGTAVKGVSSVGSTGTITRYAPEDHQHAGVFSLGVSTVGNTVGSTAVFPGQFVFAGGNNITLSQSTAAGNLATITISGGAGGSFTGGVSTAGNTSGTTGTVSNGILFVGGNNITLSQSSGAGGATVTISAPSGGGLGVSSGGNTLGTTGTVDFQMVFVGGTNITLSQSINGSSGTISFLGQSGTQPPIGTAVKGVSSIGSTGTITRYAPEDHQHAGVFSIGISTGGNTSGTTAILPGQMVFAGGNNITLSQSSAAGNLMTLTISGPSGGGAGISTGGNTAGTSGTVGAQLVFVGGNNVTLSGSTAAGGSGTITISMNQPLRSKYYWSPEGATSSVQNTNSGASFQFIEIPYDLSFTRVDVPIFLSLASSATANTGNILISSGLVIYSVSNSSTLNPITGLFGTTTYTWASNTANFNSISGARMASFGINTTLSAGIYHVGFQLSTTNNSSIGTATTQLANTVSVYVCNPIGGSFAEFGSVSANSAGFIRARGTAVSSITATNATQDFVNIAVAGSFAMQGNFPVLFRGF